MDGMYHSMIEIDSNCFEKQQKLHKSRKNKSYLKINSVYYQCLRNEYTTVQISQGVSKTYYSGCWVLIFIRN